MLRTLPESQKHKWKDSLNKVVHAYNTSRNDATGFSPFYLLFGCSTRLTVDLMFGLSRDDLCMKHTECNDLARQNISKSADDGKKQYDRKVQFSRLQPSDQVLVCNLSECGGPGKLRSPLEQELHLMVEQKGDLPVYEVTPEGRKGKSRILHRNLLLPCDFVQSDLSKPVPQRTQEKRSVPANQGSKVHQRGCDSGDEGELLGLSPTELEILSTPTAETNNHGQENMDGSQDDLLPEDMENLSEHGEDTPVTENCFLSDSETEREPLLQQEAAGSHYPVRNHHPTNILCYDHLGNPSYNPISTLSTPATNANISVYSPRLPVTPYRTLAMHNHWMIPYYTAVYLASVPFVPQAFTSMCQK